MAIYKINDMLKHPRHGVCKVIGVRNNKKGNRYVLRPEQYIPGDFKIIISEKNIRQIGLRRLKREENRK